MSSLVHWSHNWTMHVAMELIVVVFNLVEYAFIQTISTIMLHMHLIVTMCAWVEPLVPATLVAQLPLLLLIPAMDLVDLSYSSSLKRNDEVTNTTMTVSNK
ncbi:PREDICTED: uncharacterized protein LOC109340092 isoform X2 [Lupinus angustifolius]|uniref:uncharacterized protein LOC109340092 isoform X2 n=1 Tax=Lupinus angustifolius TaxID=3871 RepID=UPI00092E3FED|nr:PREDICTED: uncharacterized protein LOC109340092 isoform X2 [Lupinus angustifolius]